MTVALGRKQTSDHGHWLAAWADIADTISRDHVDALVDRTVAEVRRICRGNVAYAWSGGKDSQALRYVMERAGILESVLVITELEYPEFLRWATDEMPGGLEVVNTGQDLDWLAAHPEMLFPADAKTAARWFKSVQHQGQEIYARRRGVDILALGRRRADGNYVGDGGIYTDAHGVTRYSPIRNWTHEEVLATLFYYGLQLAPCYRWPRGFRVGTGPWPARQWTRDHEHGWEEVWMIDQSVVRSAASRLPGAQAFLARLG